MSRSRPVARWSLRVGVSAGLLALVFSNVPVGEVGGALVSADPLHVALGLGLVLCMQGLAAFRMRLLTRRQGMRLGLRQIFEASTVGTLYGLALPGSISGGIVHWARLSRVEGRPGAVLAAIAMGRWAQLTSLVTAGLLLWSTSRVRADWQVVGIVFAFVLVGLLGVFLFVFHASVAGRAFRSLRLLDRLPVRGAPGTRLEAWLAPLRVYHDLPVGSLAAVLTLSAAIDAAGIASVLLFAQALDLSVPWSDIGWVRSATSLLTMLPVTWMGLGLQEGSFMVLLEPHGVSGAEAVALSFLRLGGVLLLAAIGALFELAAWRR